MLDPELRNCIPEHVRDHQVFEYDYFNDLRVERAGDVQLGMHALHEDAPDIFYTPRNGGFWMVTRLDLMSKILTDTEHFSSRVVEIPKYHSDNVMIPLNLDPPEHLQYRMVLMRHFSPASVRAMEPQLRHWARRLIEAVIPRGHCEFVEEVGAAFPVSVFMKLMGYALERFEEFRGIVHNFYRPGISAEGRISIQNQIIAIAEEYFAARRKQPQNDLISKLLAEKVKGRLLTTDELHSIALLLFLAGLDTVANTLSFTFNYLAQRPDLQERLTNHPNDVIPFVEESLRRFSIIQQPRIVKKDIELNGAQLRVDDMVVCCLPAAGMDDRRNSSPESFDIDRKDRAHIAFSIGPHTCIGNFLARTEMRILIEEWLQRIPRFRRRPNCEPGRRTGAAAALSDLYLEWQT